MPRRRRNEQRSVDPRGFAATIERHFDSLRVRGYSENTIDAQAKTLGRFIAWCEERDVRGPPK
jgi:site-specific recombinase XerD